MSSIDAIPAQQVPHPTGGAANSTPDESRPGGAQRVSRSERVGLFVHRGLDKWLTPLGVWVVRRTNGAVADSRIARLLGASHKVDVLLLTTLGRRSGRARTVVLQFFPEGDAMIVAAANDGGTAHPGWYFNLQGDPSARAEVMGRTFPVRAEELPPEAAAEAWQRILRRAPEYERYARATSRTFPIVRLVPAPEQSADAPAAASAA